MKWKVTYAFNLCVINFMLRTRSWITCLIPPESHFARNSALRRRRRPIPNAHRKRAAHWSSQIADRAVIDIFSARCKKFASCWEFSSSCMLWHVCQIVWQSNYGLLMSKYPRMPICTYMYNLQRRRPRTLFFEDKIRTILVNNAYMYLYVYLCIKLLYMYTCIQFTWYYRVRVNMIIDECNTSMFWYKQRLMLKDSTYSSFDSRILTSCLLYCYFWK